MLFEVVSAKRVDSVQGMFGKYIFWKEDATRSGLIVVLKRKTFEKSYCLLSTDYSLHYGDENGVEIPSSPVVGISYGMKAPDEAPAWVLGEVSRTQAKEGEAYFALLFEAPKKYQEFSLRYATPLADGIKVPAQ
jgi:hypothetical protein